MELKRALTILTKVPITGLTKTRLAPALTLEGVATLYRSFLLDTIDLVIKVSHCSFVIAYTPRESGQVLRDIVKKPIEYIPQSSGDLGDRMNKVFKDLFARGYESAIIIGADSPTLPLSHLEAAFAARERKPVVLGPSLDGGYYLIGLRTPQPGLFEGIDWSTKRVMSQTIERAKKLGLQVLCIKTWYDVDTVDDLNFLVSHLKLLMASGRDGLPHQTVDALRQLGLLL